MKKTFITLLLAALPALSWASGGVHLDKAPIDMGNMESLQRGAKYFVNYCLSCHSAKYMRYNRMGQDLGITDKEIEENMLFTGGKVGGTMDIAMTPEQAEAWFGITPPDLSVITRARGADYVYTYLRTFYKDESRPFGVNNMVLAGASMPHVLQGLQGVTEAEMDEQGKVHGVKVVEPGKLSEAEFDQMVGDLTNFMVYMGEPAQLERAKYGPWVLLFLVFFTIVAYMLKKEYWKDVH